VNHGGTATVVAKNKAWKVADWADGCATCDDVSDIHA
jgi:hypothetical protein